MNFYFVRGSMNLFWLWDVGVCWGFVYCHQNGALAGCQNGGAGEVAALSGHDLRASPTASYFTSYSEVEEEKV